MVESDPLSVLVVDEEPEILAFLASLLDKNDMRALLARDAREATDIAKRGYVPIDLVLSDIVVKESKGDSGVSEIAGAELVNRVREIRPGVRVLYMSAYIEGSVIRIQLVNRRRDEELPTVSEPNLIEAIRAAAVAPLTFRGSFGTTQ